MVESLILLWYDAQNGNDGDSLTLIVLRDVVNRVSLKSGRKAG